MSKQLLLFFKRKGIPQRIPRAYTGHRNEVAERIMRPILSVAWALPTQKSVLKMFYADAVATAIFAYKRVTFPEFLPMQLYLKSEPAQSLTPACFACSGHLTDSAYVENRP